MAKAEAVCTCSRCDREFTVTAVKRNRREADDFEHWAENSVTTCRDCELAEKREAERKKSAHADELIGDVPLTGSEKQKAWATDVRRSLVRGTMEEIERMKEKAKGEKDERLVSSAEEYLSWAIRRKTSSSFWIDARDRSSLFRVRAAAEEWIAEKKAGRRENIGREDGVPNGA